MLIGPVALWALSDTDLVLGVLSNWNLKLHTHAENFQTACFCKEAENQPRLFVN